VPAVIAEAARDLAIINSVQVDGFGWIKRDHNSGTSLEGVLPTYRAFVFEHLEADLALLGTQALRSREVAAILRIVARAGPWLDVAQGRLAHGDFDATHIYQEHGRYSGIIDFGEIRGADSFFDLGHFLLHDGETTATTAFPALLRGYRAAVSLPPDDEQRVCWSSMLIAIRTLARQIGKGRDIRGHPGVAAIRHAIATIQV
jgi:hypothetical protein